MMYREIDKSSWKSKIKTQIQCFTEAQQDSEVGQTDTQTNILSSFATDIKLSGTDTKGTRKVNRIKFKLRNLMYISESACV